MIFEKIIYSSLPSNATLISAVAFSCERRTTIQYRRIYECCGPTGSIRTWASTRSRARHTRCVHVSSWIYDVKKNVVSLMSWGKPPSYSSKSFTGYPQFGVPAGLKNLKGGAGNNFLRNSISELIIKSFKNLERRRRRRRRIHSTHLKRIVLVQLFPYYTGFILKAVFSSITDQWSCCSARRSRRTALWLMYLIHTLNYTIYFSLSLFIRGRVIFHSGSRARGIDYP